MNNGGEAADQMHKAGHLGIPARQLAEIPRSPHNGL